MTRPLAALAVAALFLSAAVILPARATQVTASPSTQPSSAAAPPAALAGPAAVVGLSGEIDDYNRDSFFKRFDQAKADGAKTIIVELHTWGGLVTAGLDISSFLKRQSDVHTIAFVNHNAISAGAMIAMACDEIVMTPGGMIGDCAPIARKSDGSLETLPTAERAKLQSPIAADFYDSALRNHHDPLLAEAMVVTEVVVYWVENPDTHERRFVDQKDYDALTKEGWKPVEGVPNPLDPADKLFTVNTELAVKVGLASGKASSAQELAASRGLAIKETLSSGFGEAAIAWLNSGWVRTILIMIFGAALYAAMHAPGHGASEAIAVTCLGLLLGVPLLAGYATWWEIVLILGGIAMIAFEVFVFPHTGLMVVAGVLMMLVGLVLTFVGGEPGGTHVVPHLEGTVDAIKRGLAFVTLGLVCSALLCVWISRYLPKIPYFGRLVLNTTSGGSGAGVGAVTTTTAAGGASITPWPPVGAMGRTTTPLRPGGSAEFPDPTGTVPLIYSVVSESGYMPAGTPVLVREVGGGRVVVRSTTA
jgi:membrane-bound serine protease (ClpP class)